jgi:hypothetical protein
MITEEQAMVPIHPGRILRRELRATAFGQCTAIGGGLPARYVSPRTKEDAKIMMIGVQRYFDFGNHDNVRKIVSMYFDNGYPYEPHLRSINSDLADLRTMRNACAHISSSTHAALEGLALRIFGNPRQGITVYQLLTSIDPRSSSSDTVLVTYRKILIAAAELIARG